MKTNQLCKLDSKFLEFYGIMIGDGCLSKYIQSYDHRERKVVCITCNAIKDYYYVTNYIRNLLIDIYKLDPYIKINKKYNEIVVYITERTIFDSLNQQGFPIGKKIEIQIPNQMLKLSFKKISHLIRGIFDTDGCISARRDTSYHRAIIFLSSKSLKLKKQLKHILEAQGFSVYLSKEYISLSGNKNLKKWFELIASSNPRNLDRYNKWLKTGKILLKGQ